METIKNIRDLRDDHVNKLVLLITSFGKKIPGEFQKYDGRWYFRSNDSNYNGSNPGKYKEYAFSWCLSDWYPGADSIDQFVFIEKHEYIKTNDIINAFRDNEFVVKVDSNFILLAKKSFHSSNMKVNDFCVHGNTIYKVIEEGDISVRVKNIDFKNQYPFWESKNKLMLLEGCKLITKEEIADYLETPVSDIIITKCDIVYKK